MQETVEKSNKNNEKKEISETSSENISSEDKFNIVGGALSGTTGASIIGNFIFPGFGMLLGGVIGGIVTGYSVYNKIKKEKVNHNKH